MTCNVCESNATLLDEWRRKEIASDDCCDEAQHRALKECAAAIRAACRHEGYVMVDLLSALRPVNVDRCVTAFGHQLTDWTVMEWGCAIGGEAGELLNILKKIRREEQGVGGSRVENPKQAVADEIADIIIYCDLLAARMGIDLREAIAHKFNETSRKMGYDKLLTAAERKS